jgi:hypothetical protein
MRFFTNQLLGLVAGSLVMVTAAAQPAQAAPPVVPSRPNVVPSYTPARSASQVIVYPQYNGGSNRPIGWDWWRTYPYSNYNAWRNSYWYPPYNYNYPYAPYEAYPYYPVPPVPQPAPIPQPWGIGSSYR